MLFSIITVTYNASRWIERTIQSVISQSYSHIEYIIIDGNSTDGTPEIIKKYQSSIAYFVSEPDKGLYDAMNKGLKSASGDYVWFLNAGDTIYSDNTVQEIVNTLGSRNLPDIIYGETQIVDEQGNSVAMRRLKAPEKLTWKSFRMGMLVCHQSFLVKRAVAESYDLQYRFAADYEWCIRCMKKAKTLFNTRLILSRFLEAGLSAANRKKSLKERYRIMCENYGKIPTQIRHVWFAVRFYIAKWTKKTVS
ncbi:MAG: glycosyltransferase [Candidatus Azobacteroides sp.]|nr:glycosyltransferase [Candidatus Azobacteroides sp.]